MTLFGVGDKVADCVLLFSLEKLDSFPIDRWVRRAVEEWYSVGENPSYDAIRTWGPGLFRGACGLRPAVPFPTAEAAEEAG